MKTTKKLFSMLLALIMVVSAAMPAFAASDDYTITITNSDAISSAGHVYKAYQIFKGTLKTDDSDALGNIEWGDNINGTTFITELNNTTDDATKKAVAHFVKDGVNIFKDAKTAKDVANILAENKTADIVNAFAAVATAKKIGNPIAESAETDAPYTIKIPKEKAGYYLVVDTLNGTDTTNKDISDFILQVAGNTTVEHKGSIPTMEKTVSETGENYYTSIVSGIGDVHYYKIVAELPDDYALYDTYKIVFKDTMSKGLTFIDGTGSKITMKALIRSSNKNITIDPSSYRVDVVPNADGTTSLEVTIDNTKATTFKSADVGAGNPHIILSSSDAIEIIYSATVDKNAVVDGKGIPNNAYLEYSNDPKSDGTGTTTPDGTLVYPITLEVIKHEANNVSATLADAEFVLAREHSDGVNTHMEYALVEEVTDQIPDGSGGFTPVTTKKIKKWVHHYTGDGCESDNTDHQAAETAGDLGTILVTDSNGKISVSGLDARLYFFIETKAPAGYNNLTAPVEVKVTAKSSQTTDRLESLDATTNQGKATTDANIAKVTVMIPNYVGQTLPQTGGIGTTLFYVVGGAMVAFAVLSLITKKRMNKE